MTDFPPEFYLAREAAMAALDGYRGMDDLDPKAPAGHVKGLRVSSRLTSEYRQRIKGGTVDATPQEVIECLIQAQIEDWVLIGLQGYVGYLPQPRATQDVDIMVPYSQRDRTAKAIAARWPMLLQVTQSQVVRFLDPTDLDFDGNPQPVIDIMLPWGKFQESILKNHAIVLLFAPGADTAPTEFISVEPRILHYDECGCRRRSGRETDLFSKRTPPRPQRFKLASPRGLHLGPNSDPADLQTCLKQAPSFGL